jgi:hypothetical protein
VKVYIFSIVLAISVIGCSSSNNNTTPTDATGGLKGAVEAVKGAVAEVGNLSAPTTSFHTPHRVLQNESVLRDNSFGADWSTNTPFNNPITDSGSITTAQFLQIQLDPDAVRENGSYISPLGRLSDDLAIMCIISVLFPTQSLDANQMPIISSTPYELELTEDKMTEISDSCGVDISQDFVSRASFGAIVSAPTNTSIYDLVITITMPEEWGGGDFLVYLRNNTSETNIGTFDSDTHDSNDYGYRTTVQFNKTTGLLRMEYLSVQFDGLEDADSPTVTGYHNLYRIYYHQTNDIGAIYFAEGRLSAGADNLERFVITGQPNASPSLFNLSMISNSLAKKHDDPNFLHRACVNGDTMELSVDGDYCTDPAVAAINAVVGPSVNTGLESTTMGAFKSVPLDVSMDFDLTNILTRPLVQLID